ncbi:MULTISPECIES: sce7726 family protein [Tenacibaculum]|uniref:sce7726 family protein n=1 Tax=Tenacibaculum TaxID=104267 RepID=UPI001F0B2134|nr:sce7726 family protein [Tenacibaculum aquimarinum]MCH3882384.1 sce7726 family protein [Tenacibaculum aquimarinum]
MDKTSDITQIRSLAQIFSASNFKKIVREDNYFDTFYRINRYAKINENTTNLEVFNQIYKSLLKVYKNEYVYKNVLINKLLIKKYSLKNTIALNEFKVGNSIADFVLLNGEARIYEIKTELDGLEKLDKQISDYEKFADKIYIVTSSKHIPNLLTKYYNSNIGIIELTNRNALKTLKEAKVNQSVFNHETLFKTLRKDEYLSIIKSYFNVVPNVPNTQIFRECLKLSKKIDILEFQKLVIQKLKFRNISNPESFKERQIPEALKHICYSLNFSDNEYQQLDNFLSQKSKVCISHMLEVNNLN